MESNFGIYRIISPSGSIYIGMTMNSFEGRWRGHLKDLKASKHKCKGLQRAYLKYGWENFTLEKIETIPVIFTEKYVLEKEQYWWDHYKALNVNIYNGRPTGTGSVHHTVESKQKLSQRLQDQMLKEIVWYSWEVEGLFNKGYSHRDIASELSITLYLVKRIIKHYKLERQVSTIRVKTRKKILDGVDLVDLRFNQKMLLRDIAAKYDCTLALVSYELKKLQKT